MSCNCTKKKQIEGLAEALDMEVKEAKSLSGIAGKAALGVLSVVCVPFVAVAALVKVVASKISGNGNVVTMPFGFLSGK